MTWQVYILRCADDTFYTGITADLQRRVDEHNHGRRTASKYTRSRRPVTLVYSETVLDRAAATRRELEIKSMKRQRKIDLIETGAE